MSTRDPPYAKLTATLLAETLLEDSDTDFVTVFTRYIAALGFTSLDNFKDDLLWGADAVAAFLGRSPRTVFLWVETGRFPYSKLGKGGIVARKSVILCWLLAQELKNMRG
jgi:hypothetical protein